MEKALAVKGRKFQKSRQVLWLNWWLLAH